MVAQWHLASPSLVEIRTPGPFIGHFWASKLVLTQAGCHIHCKFFMPPPGYYMSFDSGVISKNSCWLLAEYIETLKKRLMILKAKGKNTSTAVCLVIFSPQSRYSNGFFVSRSERNDKTPLKRRGFPFQKKHGILWALLWACFGTDCENIHFMGMLGKILDFHVHFMLIEFSQVCGPPFRWQVLGPTPCPWLSAIAVLSPTLHSNISSSEKKGGKP